MRKGIILATLLLSALSMVGQQSNCPTATPTCQTYGTPVAVSGTAISIPSNGGAFDGFEYLWTGSPSAVSVPIVGCFYGGTCDAALDTYTGTTNVIRNPAIAKPYNYFIITPTWSGPATFTVNSRQLAKAPPTAGGGAVLNAAQTWTANQTGPFIDNGAFVYNVLAYGSNLSTANTAAVGGNGGEVGVPSGAYSFTSDMQVGNSTSKIPVNLFLQPGAKVTVNTSDASNPICIAEGSSIGGWGGVAGTGGGVASEFLLGSSASVSNFLQACNQTGATQGFRLSGLTLHAAGGAQIAGAMLDWKGQFSGSGADHVTINGFNSGYGMRLWADSGTAVGTTVIGLHDIVVAGATGNASGEPVIYMGPVSGSGKSVGDIALDNVSSENGSAGQSLIEFNGVSTGSYNPFVTSISWHNCHQESGAQPTTDGTYILDSAGILLDTCSFTDPGNRAALINQTQQLTNAGINLVNWANNSWPISVQNWVNSQGSSTISGTVNIGDTSFTAASATNLQPGSPIWVRDGQNSEYVTTASTYTAGSTTVTLAAGFTIAHTNAALRWNPDTYSGRGSQGINGVLTSTNESRDSNGVVTVTTSQTVHTLYQNEKARVYDSVDTTLNSGVVNVSVGAQCKNGAGAAGACNANQFEYQNATHSSGTFTSAFSAYYKVPRFFNYYTPGDDLTDISMNKQPYITGPVRIDNGETPTHVEIDGFKDGASGTVRYDRLWLGMVDPLSTNDPASCPVGDFCSFVGENFPSTSGIADPNYNFGTDSTNNGLVNFWQHGNKNFVMGTDGNMTSQGSSAFVGTAQLNSTSTVTTQAPGTSNTTPASTAFVANAVGASSHLIVSACTLGVQSTVPSNNGAAANLYSCIVPSNIMPATGCLRITAYYNHSTGTTSTTYAVNVGAASLTILASDATSGLNNFVIMYCNNGSTSSGGQTMSKVLSTKSNGNSAGIAFSATTQASTGTLAVTVTATAAGTADVYTPDQLVTELLQ